MRTKVLIVGQATDGPESRALALSDERKLVQLMGGLHTERFTLTPTTSSIVLSYEPYRLPTTMLDGSRENYIYAPNVSGQVLIFGSVGTTGGVLDVQYLPYLGQSDLLWAARYWLKTTNSAPYIARIPGSRASLRYGDWLFTAKHHGAKYNDVLITSASGGITISGLEPTYPTRVYSGYTATELPQLIQRDYDLGLCPLFVELQTSTIPTVTANLTGGLDGTFNNQSMQLFLDSANIPADCSHILFLTNLTSAYVPMLVQHIADHGGQPRVMMFAAPEYVQTEDLYLQSLPVQLPARHPLISMMLGNLELEMDGRRVVRYAMEAGCLAMSVSPGSNLTNIAMPSTYFTPQLSKETLDELKLNGIMGVTRRIMKDVATYEAVNSARSNTFLFTSKVAEMAAIAYPYLLQYLGRTLPQGDNPSIAQVLRKLLAAVEWVTFDRVDCYVIQDVMYVNIEGALPDEILKITFTVKNF